MKWYLICHVGLTYTKLNLESLIDFQHKIIEYVGKIFKPKFAALYSFLKISLFNLIIVYNSKQYLM